MDTYTTIQGDTWDLIAYKIYGAEGRATELMGANYRHLDTLVFSTGTVLNVPEIPDKEGDSLPGWRTSSGDGGIDPYEYDDE